MDGLTVLMLVFSFLIMLAGLYLYTGHKSELLLWKTHNVKKMTKSEVQNVGKWTMISSVIPLIIALISWIF